MHKFAGLDGHTSSCTLGVVNPKGKHLSCQVVETNGEALVNAVTSIPGKLHLCLEEGTQSSWLAEILSPHVEELVVVGVGRKRSKGPKDDKRDAFALADMLRNNDLESVVYKQVGPFSTLRQLVKVHAQIVRDVVRVKNRLHSLYRARGLRSDRTIYMPGRRASWLDQVAKLKLCLLVTPGGLARRGTVVASLLTFGSTSAIRLVSMLTSALSPALTSARRSPQLAAAQRPVFALPAPLRDHQPPQRRGRREDAVDLRRPKPASAARAVSPALKNRQVRQNDGPKGG